MQFHECVDRRHMIEIDFIEIVQDRLLHLGYRRQFMFYRFLRISYQQIGLFKLAEDFLCACDDRFRKTCKLCDLNTETLIRASPNNLSKEQHIIADLLDRYPVIDNAFQLAFQTQRIEDLNIKLKRVQAATTTATQTKVEIKTVIRDSIIYVDSSRIATLPAIKWQDPWVKVDGIIMPDSTVDLSIQSVDTLYQVVHRVPKKFWFIRYGTKAIRQEITSSNPHTKIVYSEYIELKGRKKK